MAKSRNMISQREIASWANYLQSIEFTPIDFETLVTIQTSGPRQLSSYGINEGDHLLLRIGHHLKNTSACSAGRLSFPRDSIRELTLFSRKLSELVVKVESTSPDSEENYLLRALFRDVEGRFYEAPEPFLLNSRCNIVYYLEKVTVP